MADLIDRKTAMGALEKIQYWNPEDRYRAVKAVSGCPAATEPRPIIQAEQITLRNIMGEFHAKVVEPTAEEMFRAAGYHLDYTNRMQTLYRKDADPKCYIELDADGCYRGYDAGAMSVMSWSEVAACLRWKQEQEADLNA